MPPCDAPPLGPIILVPKNTLLRGWLSIAILANEQAETDQRASAHCQKTATRGFLEQYQSA